MRRCLAALLVAGLVAGCGDSGSPVDGPGPMPVAGRPHTILGLGLELLPIPAGSFRMGSEDGDPVEQPVHEVRLTQPFWLGKTEVTQSQWEAAMGTSVVDQRNRHDPRWPGWRSFRGVGWRQLPGAVWREVTRPRWSVPGEGANYPMYYVNWEEAMAFCAKLTEGARTAGRLPDGYEYRLQTEAEWEYACRVGSASRYCFGDDEARLGDYAWYWGNSGRRTHEVATRLPNEWGLHDLHGNVWEWCIDWDGDYPAGPVTDPQGPGTGFDCVTRGGSWGNAASYCRSAYRRRNPPGDTNYYLGFRVALAPAVRR